MEKLLIFLDDLADNYKALFWIQYALWCGYFALYTDTLGVYTVAVALFAPILSAFGVLPLVILLILATWIVAALIYLQDRLAPPSAS